MNKLLLSLLCLTAACAQSRKGIKPEEKALSFEPVTWCDTWNQDRCDTATVHLEATLNYTDNSMDFEVLKMPYQPNGLGLRLKAKKPGEGKWYLFKSVSLYNGKSLGKSENLYLEPGMWLRLRPLDGTIEQYREWRLETMTGGTLGTTSRTGSFPVLWDVFSFSELDKLEE